jgi:hypothetical protein
MPSGARRKQQNSIEPLKVPFQSRPINREELIPQFMIEYPLPPDQAEAMALFGRFPTRRTTISDKANVVRVPAGPEPNDRPYFCAQSFFMARY